ncbi:MAG TPA: ATP-binding protein [Thermoanaerobaculia bacterium]|nr:ATP-binding protein [Thermoanaerobaculia bacterium]
MTEKTETVPTLTSEEMLNLFGVLSHDLKSPIFSIDGFSELLQSDYADKLDEDGRDFLARIRSSVGHMKRTLDEMSHVVKLLSRPQVIGPVALKDLFEEIRLRFANLIDEGKVDVRIPEDLPVINSDPERLREAISALFSNALTFTDRGAGERIVEVTTDRADGEFRLCVRDNGLGFEMKYGAQIFDLGLKLDKQRGTGPGYGLFVAKRISEGLGGTIEMDSTPGEGSRFCLNLPDRSS